MPSGTVEIAVLDTSVYIENYRTGRFTDRITRSGYLFRGVTVVIHELLRGAGTPEERQYALDLAANLPCTPRRNASGSRVATLSHASQ